MSPLAPPNVRGYPDWQRIENWDSPVLFEQINVNVASGVVTSGVQDVSHFAYLGGLDNVSSGDEVNVAVRWYTDPQGTNLIGAVGFLIGGPMIATAQYRLPNIGPFVKLTWTNNASGNPFTHSCEILGTNRSHPLTFIPDQSLLMQRNSQGVPAGGSTRIYPGAYFAGPAKCYVSTTGPGMSLTVATGTPSFVTNPVDYQALPTGPLAFTTVIPTGVWWVDVSNPTAAGQAVTVNIVGSYTGGT